ncbi:hypothetical protein PR001_g18696 [Phytophthora rubi]|uniref:EGF-like domain-containing protein n=1 Tax=Phytophthora rubi TaxID=129364 RepID=A0A6A3JZT9_9STRA|nr:hypothetical protein PR001_g18696 [Phytophthora rubi]
MVLASSYSALDDGVFGLSAATAPDTTVAASVLIVPPLMSGTAQAFGNETETKSVDELSARTQLMYNCTSTSNLWYLLEDPNVLKLEEFQQFSGVDGSSFGSSSSSTTGLRGNMTIALIEVADCFTTQSSSIGRPVVLNSFFDPAMTNTSAVYLYVENSSILGSSVNELAPSRRRVCSLMLPSIRNVQSPQGNSEPAFMKDLSCYYGCGAEGADSDKCFDYYKLTLYKCKMKFYSENEECNFGCVDKTGHPYDQPALPANKCYDCYWSLLWWCDPGFEPVDSGCCRTLDCPEIPETDTVSPTTFTYNLGADRKTIKTPSMEIYSKGDCSNPADLTSDCCRVTCENCFFNLSIASMFADVDVYPTSFEVYTATEMKMVGNSNLKLKVFAPNGCLRPSAPLKSIPVFPTVSIPLGASGLFFEAGFSIEMAVEISVKPHRSSVDIGSTQILEVKAGQVNAYDFFDQLIQITTPSDLAKTGIDITVEFGATPIASVAISFVGVGKAGIKAGVPLFLRLEAAIKYPTPFAALTTLYYDPKSWFQGGNCANPHFIPWTSIGYTYQKPLTKIGSGYSQSLASGCIASAYDALMQLTTATSAVGKWTMDKLVVLQKVVMLAFNVPEIDPNFVTITVYTNGQISIKITIPPSVADKYPTQSQLEAQLYQVARTSSFAKTVSSLVGMDMVSQCSSGLWGATCSNQCTLSRCALNSVSCNSFDGSVTSCSACVPGYWGSPTCNYQCSSLHCRAGSMKCDFATGTLLSCSSCETGWWGPTCSSQCASPNCRSGSVNCDSQGNAISCSACNNDCSCKTGSWGPPYCANACLSPHCSAGSASCDFYGGSLLSCSSCEIDWWGPTCGNQCVSAHCIGSISCDSQGSAITCSSCEEGWYGSTCSNQCASPHCKTGSVKCTPLGLVTSCGACETGWWGPTCSYLCTSSHCTSGSATCDARGNAISCSSCEDGWYDTTCSKPCTSTHCTAGFVKCSADYGIVSSCGACETGWWGETCGRQCSSSRCASGSMSCSISDGSVTMCSSCNPGYWGWPTCSETCTSPHCTEGSVSCAFFQGDVIACSSCEEGWWGSTCETPCTSDHCTGSVSCDAQGGAISCSSCEEGWWGETCSNQCASPHCSAGSVSCNSDDGAVSACGSRDDGYWGSMCENRCTVPIQCESSRCEQQSGEIIECLKCEDGFYGPQCESACTVLEHCNGPRCDKEMGSTVECLQCDDGFYGSVCAVGWWGRTCSYQCSSYHCPADTVSCDSTDGTVSGCSSCEDGYWGPMCENDCDVPEHCWSSRCEQQSGDQVQCLSCGGGYWGPTCDEPCTIPENCGSATCDQHFGGAIDCLTCADGWWGSMCRQQCIATHCSGNVTCNSYSGATISCEACVDGWWDAICDNQCTSPHCAAGFVSCEADGVATSCSACENGYWGPMCESSCELQEHCKSIRCAQNTGSGLECTECEDGWEGALCDTTSTTASSSSANTGTGTSAAPQQQLTSGLTSWLQKLIAFRLLRML